MTIIYSVFYIKIPVHGIQEHHTIKLKTSHQWAYLPTEALFSDKMLKYGHSIIIKKRARKVNKIPLDSSAGKTSHRTWHAECQS